MSSGHGTTLLILASYFMSCIYLRLSGLVFLVQLGGWLPYQVQYHWHRQHHIYVRVANFHLSSSSLSQSSLDLLLDPPGTHCGQSHSLISSSSPRQSYKLGPLKVLVFTTGSVQQDYWKDLLHRSFFWFFFLFNQKQLFITHQSLSSKLPYSIDKNSNFTSRSTIVAVLPLPRFVCLFLLCEFGVLKG